MSIDAAALRDPRVRRLARTLHERFGNDVTSWPDFARRYALGTMLEIWSLPYDRHTGVIEPEDVEDVAGVSGFCDAMIAVGLGRAVENGVYISGAEKRIAQANGLRVQRSLAGQQSGKVRRRKSNAVNKREREHERATNEPLSSSMDMNGSASSFSESESPVVVASVESPISVGRDAVDGVLRRFGDRTLERHGVRPSIRSLTKAVRRGLRELVKEHGEVEMLRRADIAVDNPPDWPPERPWTIAMFVTHNDRLVSTSRAAANGAGSLHRAAMAAIERRRHETPAPNRFADIDATDVPMPGDDE